jgi:UDP-2-acetamido-2-deoxy-ribo-hexuluronate aminotransferase
VEFVDLKAQYRAYRSELDAELSSVLESCRFIGGPVIEDLEQRLAEYVGVRHAVCCASGTDAILLCLMAYGVGPGDEVIVPNFTFAATAEVVSLLRATPVFVDVDEETFNIDVRLIEERVTAKTRGIIPVSLYGQCADCEEVNRIAARRGLWVMEDAAQSFGAVRSGRKSGSLTETAATSFFPAKPLGCYGDGGAVFTDDEAIAGRVRMILNHGQRGRYNHVVIGLNGRLDAMQAAVLKVKLRHLDDELALRRAVASSYDAALRGVVRTPAIRHGNVSTWAQYTIRVSDRKKVTARLDNAGVPWAVHYPKPLSEQEAFAYLCDGRAYGVSHRASAEVLSLPMHPFLTTEEIAAVTRVVTEACS